MQFNLSQAVEILERTPVVLHALLHNVSDGWSMSNEGRDTWSAYDVVGHLIHGEKKDWVERMNIILGDKADKRFEPFDRFAQFDESKGKALNQLLDEFTALRKNNITFLRNLGLNESKLNLKGIHPKFGEVTLRQLLATWATHDLAHISQICRVMAKQYKTEIGAWVEYMNIINKG